MIKKKLPQAIDMEIAVLGALIIQPNSFYDLDNVLFADAFFLEKHQIIFEAIQKMHIDNLSIDLITLSEFLRKNKKLDSVGKEYYLVELTNRISSAVHITNHARIVIDKYILRRVILESKISIDCAYDDIDCFKLLDDSYNRIVNINELIIKNKPTNLLDIVNEQIQKSINIRDKGHLSGIKTISKIYNKITGGLQNGELTIIAARPSMGKTAFALNIAFDISKNDNSVVFFSLETSKDRLVDRIITAEAKVSSDSLNRQGISNSEYNKIQDCFEIFKNSKIIIEDASTLTVEQINIRAKVMKRKNNIKAIFIDYLQLMKCSSIEKGANREREISTISRELKKIALSLNIPVVALSQLSRNVENRENKTPKLADLRESGAIEQDADNVLFLYRPEHYGDDYIEYKNEQISSKDICKMVLSKHRNGGTGIWLMNFYKEISLFKNFILN